MNKTESVEDYYARMSEIMSHDYEYEKRALEIVKKFVKERGLIIFGGLAIDYALRLKGSKIYRDDEKPDIDVLSEDSVKDAYDLVDEFKKLGFEQVNAIRALHLQTMRVRTNFVYVADIGYFPDISIIPTLNYQGLRIAHPDFQRIDIHLSFMYPFTGAPRENLFNRWEKDLKRLNMINECYPIKVDKPTNLKLNTLEVPINDLALTGFQAYAALCLSFESLVSEVKPTMEITRNWTKLSISRDNKKLICESPELAMTFVTSEPINYKCPYYNSFVDYIPESFEDSHGSKIFSTYLQLLAVTVIEVNKKEHTSICAHGILQYMLVRYFITKDPMYLYFYKCTWNIIDEAEKIFRSIDRIDAFIDSPFCLSTETLGTKNNDMSYIINVVNDINATGIKVPIEKSDILDKIPSPYFDKRPQLFDYKSSKYFYRVGQLITTPLMTSKNICGKKLMPL